MGRRRKYASLEETYRENNAKRREQRANASAIDSSGKYQGVCSMVINAFIMCELCTTRTPCYINSYISHPGVFSEDDLINQKKNSLLLSPDNIPILADLSRFHEATIGMRSAKF